MEKKIIFIAVYLTFAGALVIAQDKKNQTATPQPPVVESLMVPPPTPVAPPPPPVPPHPHISIDPLAKPAVIINSIGYDVWIKKTKGITMVMLEKDGISKQVRLSTWNANRKLYEKKYGQLPVYPPRPAIPSDIKFMSLQNAADTQ